MAVTHPAPETAVETFGTTSPVTGDAPSAEDDGLDLSALSGMSVVISCPAAQTFSGTGTLEFYLRDPAVGAWVRSPSGDYDLSLQSVSGKQSVELEAVDVVTGRSARGKWVPAAVAFSGGATGVVVYHLGQRLKKGGI